MADDEPKAEGSLQRSVLSGGVWTFSGSVLSQVLRLGGNIVLAALLFQEAFALMAIVAAVIAGLQMFSDIGLSPSVVQNRRGDDVDFLNTAWTLQVIRGITLTTIACALSWPLASFYAANDPMAWELQWLLPLVAVGTFISGFRSSNVMSATRHIDLGRVTMIELASQVIGLLLMIAVAWMTRSVYALALGSVVSAATSCALSHLVLPGHSNKFRLEGDAARAIIHFGKWIFVSTIICFIALQADRLLFAKMFPLDQVGVYAIAASVAVLTPTLLGRIQSVVVFPLYSRMLERNGALPQIVARSKSPMLAIGGYLVALSIAGAQTFVDIAYDERYTMAGLYIAILSCGAWFATIEGIYGAAFLATGRSRLQAIVFAARIAGFLILLFPAINLAGFIGAVAAVAASDLIRLAAAILLARLIGLKKQLPDVLYSVYTLTVGLGVLWLTRYWEPLSDIHPILQLGTQLTLVSLAFIPVLILAASRLLPQKVAY